MADKEVRTAFADNIASKFKELPASAEDIETEWFLFRTAVITLATNCCGHKRVGGTKNSERRTSWWNQEVKEAIRAKNVAYKAWLANKSSLELCSQYSEARKVAATKVKLCKARAWKEFGERLDDDFKMANKVLEQTIRRGRGKRSQAVFFIEGSNGVTLKDQDAILNRWRECFSDFLNPIDAAYDLLHNSAGRVVRASAAGAVDWGLIPGRIKPMTLKLVFTASLLDAQH